MTFAEFKDSLKNDSPPDGLNDLLLALWQDAQGDWDLAHRIAQSNTTANGSWLHAYLHRKEPDPGNAAYWYNRAHRPVCQSSLEEEWQDLANHFLD